MTAETRSLLQRLQELDFSIMDTVLYLDAYPRCREALDYYHKLLGERASLLSALAKSGAPVTHFENASRDTWEWTNGPWPWESTAN
jgi:spore coat protein JB